MTVAVTGAGGFLGRALVEELWRAGADPRALDAETDLRCGDAVRRRLASLRPDAVVHLGGVSGPMVAADDPALITAVNAVGTVNVLDACRRLSPRPRVVLASSVAVVERLGAIRPTSVYAATKQFCEDVAQVFSADGVPVTVVRLGSLYGPGRRTRHIISDIALSLRAGDGIRITRTAEEPLVHVDDAARFLTRLVERGPARLRPYYLVHRRLSHRAIAEQVARSLERPLRLEVSDDPAPSWSEPLDHRPLLADTGLAFSVDVAHGIAEMAAAAVAGHDLNNRKDCS